MSYLQLTKEMYLGKGRERAAYTHPNDDTKVVKVVYKPTENLNQNELEYEYLQFLEKKSVPFDHLTHCYGTVDTNFGVGYIFERIRDYNGNTSTSFKNMVLNGVIDPKLELSLLEELKTYLLKHNIIFVDIALSNIFCQEIAPKQYKLVITDGIGGKRTGIKSKLYLYSKLFTKYKVSKQWKKLFNRYNKVIRDGIKANTRIPNA